MCGRIRLILQFLLFLAAVSAVLAVVSGFAQNRAPSQRPTPSAPPPYMRDAKSYEETARGIRVVFRSGLTVLVHEYRAQPLVSLQAYIPGGFSDDSAAQGAGAEPGLAALTAGVRLGVSGSSPGGTVRRKAQALGGSLYSRAEARHSLIAVTVPSSRWKQALRLQSEALLAPFADAAALRRDIDNVAANLRDADTPPAVRRELFGLVFGLHSQMQVPRKGAIPEMPEKPEKTEDIVEFHKKHYVPAAMTLVVAGDVLAGDVLGEIHRLYVSPAGDAKDTKDAKAANAANDAKPVGTSVQTVPSGEFRYHASPVLPNDAARLLFGFPLPATSPTDLRALEVATAILGLGESSVLNMRLRDQKGLVVRVDTKFDVSSGLLSIELETASQNPQNPQNPQDIDKAELALWTEIGILQRNGPTAADLARAVAQLERVWWERMATVEGRAAALEQAELRGEWKQLERYPAEIRRVTAADVKRVVEKHLTVRNASLLEYLPLAMAERKLIADGVRKAWESLLPLAVREELAARSVEVAPDYKIPTAAPAFRGSEMRQPFQAASILRGPELYIREDHSSPLVEMGFFFPGGKAREAGANAGITRLMLDLMLQDGNATRQLEIYGGRLEPVVADDYFGFRLAVPSRHLAEGFERLRTVVKTPSGFEDRGRPDDAKFEDLKRRHAARAGAAGVPDAVNLLEAELLREHSYAASGEATAESLKNLSLEAVRGWYAENVRNLKPFVVIVGDVQGTAPAAFFVKEFSGSRMKDGKIADDQPKPLEKPAIRDHDGSDRLSTVLIGFQAPPAGDADVYGMRALENYLGETGGVAEEIRDRKGVARRITCGYRPRLRGGSIVVTAQVDVGEESRAVAALRDEISRLLAQPLPYADFQAALAGAAGARAIRDQVKWAQIESLTEQLLAGGGDESAGGLEAYQDFTRIIEDMSEEDFQGLARRILDMDKAVTVVVHGSADAKR